MTSEKQIAANRMNSTKSSGPKSAEGKETASRNATRHGILSNSLFLPDEDPATFQQLFEELSATFHPFDTLELILVEKIAVTIWKQRRLVAAETAATILQRQASHLFKSVNSALGKYLPNDKVTEEDLSPANQNLVTWSETILKEWNILLQEKPQLTMEELEVKAPRFMSTLKQETVRGDCTIDEYLSRKGTNLGNWLRDTMLFAEKALLKARQQIEVVELYNAANTELSILADKPRASYERYQATLDNQLYRAIKELRQLQDRRMRMIEIAPTTAAAESAG